MDASFEGGNGCYFGNDGTKWTVEIPQSGSFIKSSKEITATIHEFFNFSSISGLYFTQFLYISHRLASNIYVQ